jgi:serine/threonine-protein kinase
MEFLSGQDLSRELDEQERFEPRIAIDYLLQVCEAVAEAHSLGVIHRDLKPANLFLTRRPDGSPLVKVLDFGISKAISPDVEDVGESLTAPHSLLGSPAYMSPEQIRQPKTVDNRTDIWSLGAILYEFLTGDQPFRGDTAMSVLAAVVSDPMPSMRERNLDIPWDLEKIVAKCLEKDPANRYQSIAELAHALAPHAPTAALSSVSRISGILRSIQPPKTPASTTLKSASSLPAGDEPEAQASKRGAVSATSNDKHTQTDWNASRPVAGVSRWRTRVVIVSAAALVAAILLLVVRPVGQAPGGEPVVATAAGAAAPRIDPSPKAPPVLPVVPASAAVLNMPSDAGVGRTAEAPKAKIPKASTAPTKAPTEAPAPAHATAKGLTPRPPSDDPLEGRR